MDEFKKRTKAPEKDNKNYYSKKNRFYPKYVDNCTWYCEGRLLELGVSKEDIAKHLPSSNAENWYNDTTFEKCSFPRVGDTGVFSCGKRHHSKDGMGHTFQVEEVYDDRSIDISESGSNMKFRYRHIKYPYKIWFKTKYKYTLDGFIHSKDFESKWKPGKYKILYDKYLRTTPEVKAGNKIKYKSLMKSWQEITYPDVLGKARFKTNTIRELVEFTYDEEGNIWAKCKTVNTDVWLCVHDKNGDQVKKCLE